MNFNNVIGSIYRLAHQGEERIPRDMLLGLIPDSSQDDIDALVQRGLLKEYQDIHQLVFQGQRAVLVENSAGRAARRCTR